MKQREIKMKVTPEIKQFTLYLAILIIFLSFLFAWTISSKIAVQSSIVKEGLVLFYPLNDMIVRTELMNEGPIVCFGNSITAGTYLREGATYPGVLSRNLGEYVINLGVDGDTTRDGLTRLKEVISLRPRIVVLELGINDYLYDISIEETARNLEYMIDVLRFHNATIILAAFPVTNDFRSMYLDIQQKKDITIINLMRGIYNNKYMMIADELHPNALGMEEIAERIERAINMMTE